MSIQGVRYPIKGQKYMQIFSHGQSTLKSNINYCRSELKEYTQKIHPNLGK